MQRKHNIHCLDGYTIKEILGQGAFGITFNVQNISTTNEYAAKMQIIGPYTTDNMKNRGGRMDKIQREIKIHNMAYNLNVAPKIIINCTIKAQLLYNILPETASNFKNILLNNPNNSISIIIMEKMDGTLGNILDDYINENNISDDDIEDLEESFNWILNNKNIKNKYLFLKQIVDLINKLNDNNIFHNDLSNASPIDSIDNIFYVKKGDNYIIKLSDYGIAEHITDNDQAIQWKEFKQSSDNRAKNHYNQLLNNRDINNFKNV